MTTTTLLTCANETSPRKAPYRYSQLFLRNEFACEGKWGISLVRRQEIDLSHGVELIASSDTSSADTKNLNRGVHHFVDDPRFEDIYRHPERTTPKYARYRFVITPNYSTFPEMPLWRQIESTGKSRWCGAYWQAQKLTVVPSISWGLHSSFEFCFAGIEQASTVAVSTVGCRLGRRAFMRGYDAMLERINPEAIICLGDPFPEMRGGIFPVDYQASRRVAR